MTDEKNFKHLVRIANSDMKGTKNLIIGLKGIKGVGYSLANTMCEILHIDKEKKVGYLTDEEIAKLENFVSDSSKYNLPVWILNRRKDPETGLDSHLFTSDLRFYTENDIKYMKKIKCRRGIRHSLGLPVRGQRTASNFRKNKGKALGVRHTKKTGKV